MSLTEQQILTLIGQLNTSCDKFAETDASEPEYQEYCQQIGSCVAYWKNELRKIKQLENA